MKRKILLTGATSGIGLATADHLLKQNCTILALSRQASLCPLTKETKFFPYDIDLSHLSDLEKRFKNIAKEHPDIDAIICNAGKGLLGSLEQYSSKQIQSLIDLNFTSQALLIKQFVPSLKKQKRADILFMGSEAALQGKKKGSIYCASKFALKGFAQALREELAKDLIKVSMIQPGMVDTPFHKTLMVKPSLNPECSLNPEDIAHIIAMILNLPSQAVCDEIILSPQKKQVRLN